MHWVSGRMGIDWRQVIKEIQAAIAAEPKNGDHYFNLASTAGLALQPPDLQLAKTAYQRALALGVGRDSQLDKLLR